MYELFNMMNFDLKKLIIFTILIFLNFVVSSQESLIWDDFESYSNGYDYVGNTSSWAEEGGNNSSIVSSAGNGYNSSDEYLLSGAGWDKLKYNFTVTNGETYQIYFRGQLTAYIGGALKFTIIRLNGAGTADDDTTVSSATWNTVVGGVNLNNIKDISEAGADTFVMGSAIFDSKDYEKTISSARKHIS